MTDINVDELRSNLSEYQEQLQQVLQWCSCNANVMSNPFYNASITFPSPGFAGRTVAAGQPRQ
jgi:hypothetical protein